MAALPNLNSFNNERKELVKIRNLSNEIILFTKDEARDALLRYIADELDFFTNKLGANVKIELKESLKSKLESIENAMVRHIDDKINKITEKIVSLAIDRKIEEEVTKRLDARLKKIKDSL